MVFFFYIEKCIYKSNKLLYNRQSYPAPIYACGLADIKLKNMAKTKKNADNQILATMKLEMIQAGLPKEYKTTTAKEEPHNHSKIKPTTSYLFY